LKTNDFTFDLPENLIAQYPPAERGQSRLMLINRKTRRLEHKMVRDLPSILEPGTVMVFNNSRVRRARLSGKSEKTGAKVEFLLLNRLDAFSWQVLSNRSKRRRPGSRYLFNDTSAEIISAAGKEGFLSLRFDSPIDDAWLDINGHVPLPPYIKRDDSDIDWERYQTVYAQEYGSAAAPTAGLHFTNELLADLKRAGIEIGFITLHVGLGTFLPVRTENIEDHKMHEEDYHISDETASRIEKAKAEGRKVLAVGTTSLRTLESAWSDDLPAGLRRGEGNTSIFIYPGYKMKVTDALFTNFHTPGSTLLMLVSAFADRNFILDSYREAVKEAYRFFSYGDACLIV
jgi:S-adenosylmethionine:tRNA ribosyltransferase-isomerase